jgi:small-conductance mechanosensitive channel
MRFYRIWRAALVALALAPIAPASVSTTLTQKIFGSPARKADSAAPEAATGFAERRAAIEKELAAAQQAVDQERDGKYPIPPGATPGQITELAWLLGRFPLLLQAQLDLLREIEAAGAGRKSAEEALAGWKGPEQPGPYSLTQVDGALDRLDAERARLHSFRSVGELQRAELQRVQSQLKASQADERLALEKATDGVVAPLELARLRTRRTTEQLQILRLQGELNEELTQGAKARVDLLSRESAAMSANYRFSEQELERVLKGVQSQQAVLDRQIEDVSGARSRGTAERDRTRQMLAALPVSRTVSEVHRQAELQTRLDASNATLEALRTQQSALTTLRGLLPLTMEAWRQRYTALSDSDPETRRTAEKALEAALSRVDTLRSYADDLGTLSDAALHEQQRRVDVLDEDAPGRVHELAALEAARRASDAVSEVQVLAQRLTTAQKRWKTEYEQTSRQRPTAERLAEFWTGIKDIVRTIWNFELFAVEDTVEIGGKPTTLSRGVTVGKSIGALLIFIVGYRLMGVLAGRAQRIMVERFAVDVAQARLLRRWLMLLTGFVLLVITLNLARIPLTVFAFMGGALAIGIGFGTQTLLRNFISGIIVLFERKVRVGDIVDVDGVQGVVTAVDIRSTTVRQFDGIETMVPNSLLLEQKVTNWTGESPTMRRVVKVGVAYGSPTRQVSDIMKAAADEHGLVLKEPAPYVIFEDFGDNALVFALYFWVDIARVNGMQVMSDLRFMLEKRFAEAGVTVAYPQRDVHLNAARPLQVEVVASARPAQAS